MDDTYAPTSCQLALRILSLLEALNNLSPSCSENQKYATQEDCPIAHGIERISHVT